MFSTAPQETSRSCWGPAGQASPTGLCRGLGLLVLPTGVLSRTGRGPNTPSVLCSTEGYIQHVHHDFAGLDAEAVRLDVLA